jgi:hypothetical protein
VEDHYAELNRLDIRRKELREQEKIDKIKHLAIERDHALELQMKNNDVRKDEEMHQTIIEKKDFIEDWHKDDQEQRITKKEDHLNNLIL